MGAKLNAFVQTVNGNYSTLNYYMASQAFNKYGGYNVIPFDFSEVNTLPLTKETPVFGGIECMNTVFQRLIGGTPRIKVPYYPDELGYLLGREIKLMELGNVHKAVEDGAAYFVKPHESRKKSFNGHLASTSRDLIYTAGVDHKELVYTSNPVEFISEYRVFVHKELGVLGMKHYCGHWNRMIDYSVVLPAIKAYVHSPITYSLDLGLTSTGETFLVECNDVTSLGCYGLAPNLYATLLLDRWAEIMAD